VGLFIGGRTSFKSVLCPSSGRLKTVRGNIADYVALTHLHTYVVCCVGQTCRRSQLICSLVQRKKPFRCALVGVRARFRLALLDSNNYVLFYAEQADSGVLSEWWHPLFAHQSFDEEVIKGFRDLSIEITFSDPTLGASIRVDYAEKAPDASLDDLLERVGRGVPSDWLKPGPEFGARIRSLHLPSSITSSPVVGCYTVGDDVYDVLHWRLDAEDAQAYHRRLECLAWWLIDGTCRWCVKDCEHATGYSCPRCSGLRD
jgi:hypothetical protein